MPFLLTILTLGDPSLSSHMVENSNLEFISRDEQLSHWKRSVDRGFDRVDIELKIALLDKIDLDFHIQSSDGIIYFLDPSNPQNFDLFELHVDIIQKLERTIPVIVVFHTLKGFIPIPTNYLLEYIWDNYLMEAFLFDSYSKNAFYEVVECLTESMTRGSIPINVETAWMRIPFFIKKINQLLLKERYKVAAKHAEILKNMKIAFEKQDYIITAEQAARLYTKSGEYRKASRVLKGINRQSEKFLRMHLDSLIHEANLFYESKMFSRAAEKFEMAHLIAQIELKDKILSSELVKKAIKAWIKSTDFLSAFKLMEKLDYKEHIRYLKEIFPEIGESVDILIDIEQYDMIKGSLYFILNELQENDLIEETKFIGIKLEKVLKILINQAILERNPDQANLVLEELLAFWETYSIEQSNIDDLLRDLILLYLEKGDLDYLDDLINRIQSKKIRKELSECIQNRQDEITKKTRDTEHTEFSNTISILKNYVKEEDEIFTKSNIEFLKKIDNLKNNHEIDSAIFQIKQRANWFKNIGHKGIYTELLIQLIDFYLDSQLIRQFLQEIDTLRHEDRKTYLKKNIKKIQGYLTEEFTRTQETTVKSEEVISKLIDLYRTSLLFDEVKTLEDNHIELLITQARQLLHKSKNLDRWDNIKDLIEHAEMINDGLSDKKTLEYSDIFEEISTRFIETIKTKLIEQRHNLKPKKGSVFDSFFIKEVLNDIRNANEVIEKISNSKTQHSLFKELSMIETEMTKIPDDGNLRLKYTAKLSNIAKSARDAIDPLEDVMKERTTFVRIYKTVLNLVTSKKWMNASKEYNKFAEKQIKRRYNTAASVFYLLETLCLFKLQVDTEYIVDLVNEKIVGKPFAKELLVLLIETNSHGFKDIFEDAWKLLNRIPVFTEEKILLEK